MSQAIETRRGDHQVVEFDSPANVWNRERVELLKRTMMNSQATDDEMDLFIQVCKRTGLDPFARQIYAIHRKNNKTDQFEMSIQTSIDGFRVIASRNPQYAGQTAPEWCATDGKWRSIWTAPEPPAAARIGVYRTNSREPTYAVAHYKEYVQTYFDKKKRERVPMGMWGTMPANMLAKCAESLALRKAFPAELSGLYTSEEMTQADNSYPEPERIGSDPRIKKIDESKYSPVDRNTGEIVEAETPSLPEGMQKASEIDPNRITRPQLAKIYATAKEAGFESKDELDAFVTSEFGHRTSQLSKQDASQLIEMLIEMAAQVPAETNVVEDGQQSITELWNTAVSQKKPDIQNQDLSSWLFDHWSVGHPSELTSTQVREATDLLEQILAAPF